MKPLIVLLSVFVLCFLGFRVFGGEYDVARAGRIAMSVMLLFTAFAHFRFTKGMEMMIPSFIPYKKALVYFTGIVEIAAAIMLLIPSLRYMTGWLLISFFLLILPANIHAAMKSVNLEKSGAGGKGLKYLWFRIPLQLLFICWVYFSAVSPVN